MAFNKGDESSVLIVNFPFLFGDVLLILSYGVYVSQLVRFARICNNISDFNNFSVLRVMLCNQQILPS
jgi:hypothetical protein